MVMTSLILVIAFYWVWQLFYQWRVQMSNDLQKRLDAVASVIEAVPSMAVYAAMLDTVSNTLDENYMQMRAAGVKDLFSDLLSDIAKVKDKVMSTVSKFDIKYLSALPSVLGGASGTARATSLLEQYQKPSDAMDVEELAKLSRILHAGYSEAGAKMADPNMAYEQKSELHELRKTIEDWIRKSDKVRVIWEHNGVVR